MQWTPNWTPGEEEYRRYLGERAAQAMLNFESLYRNMPPIQKHHHAKAYEAQYQFPRDLMKAIDDYAEYSSYENQDNLLSYEIEECREKADSIRDQIAAYVATIGGKS